ncbi:Pfs, NACHT and Ankyrin domain protein, partial [Metarhizium majus ARSEF 297]
MLLLACLPINQVGTNKAAIVATNMKRSFPSIRMCLVVGIDGGVPSKADVRLGDVVVEIRIMQYDKVKTKAAGEERTEVHRIIPGALGAEYRAKPTCGWLGDVVVGIRIMQYDKVKTKAAGEERTEVHRIIPGALGTVLSNFAAQDDYAPLNSRFSSILQEKLANENHRKFCPPNLEDRLFQADYEHISSEASCDRCDSSRLMIRGQRKTNTVVHYGGIASGNKVMKYGRKRDEIVVIDVTLRDS